MTVGYRAVSEAFAGTGLTVRGGFAVDPDDSLAGMSTVVLLGNVGGQMWPWFAAGRHDEPDPLDAWTRRVVAPIASQLEAAAVYPSDRPYRPFQAWAKRAEPVFPSPLGILIHPEYGLWHAYRAALLFRKALADLPPRTGAERPCDRCEGKPCLSACPVAAFDGTAYDVAACAGHLQSGAEPDCGDLGCRARDACPVAPGHRYPPEQIRFHMAAFVRSRGI